jgi:hypothetical protein
MSGGFSSLLDQFKRTTEQDAVAAIVVDGGEGSNGVRRTSTSSLRRKIGQEDGCDALVMSNQDSNKRTRHTTVTSHTTVTTTIYQRPTVPVQTIYIACPANVETGGPEALHQLCHVINNIGKEDTIDTNKSNDNTGKIRAFMLYLRERNNNNSGTNAKGGMSRIMEHVISTTACPTRYARYDAPPAPNLPGHNNHTNNNNSNNKLISSSSATNHEVIHSSEMVIWPECWTHLIDTLLSPPPGGQTTTTTNVLPYQNVIWWLSVDNNKGSFTTRDFVERRDVLHLVQSAYAYNYVTSHLRHRKEEENVNDNDGGRRRVNMSHHHPDVITLTEYIYQSLPLSNKLADENFDTATSPAVIANTPSQQPTLLRDIDVVYNPAKGIHYTNEIIRRAGQTLQIVPIGKGLNGQVRMTDHEVTNLLHRAKVYIDFGPHPGMDRLPREAALAGCIVITNRDGAAGYDIDVPLPSEFKFGGMFSVDNVYALLRDICIRSSSHDKNNNNNEEDEKLTRYEVYVNKMKPYVDWIHGQERRMKDCVDRFINEVVTLRQLC